MALFLGWVTQALLYVLLIVAATCYAFWDLAEERLKPAFQALASRKLGGVEVTFGTLKIRRTFVELRDVRIANSPGEFSAPYFAHLRLLRIQLTGLRDLLALPGVLRLGPSWSFAVGFTIRRIETVDFEGLDIRVEEKKHEGSDSEWNCGAWDFAREQWLRRRARRLSLIKENISAFKKKWAVKDDGKGEQELASGEAKKEDEGGQSEEEEDDQAAVDEIGKSFFADDQKSGSVSWKEQILERLNSKKQDSRTQQVVKRLMGCTTTQIGRFTCKDIHIDYNGRVMTLGDEVWEKRGFIGTDQDFGKHVGLPLMAHLTKRGLQAHGAAAVKESIGSLAQIAMQKGAATKLGRAMTMRKQALESKSTSGASAQALPAVTIADPDADESKATADSTKPQGQQATEEGAVEEEGAKVEEPTSSTTFRHYFAERAVDLSKHVSEQLDKRLQGYDDRKGSMDSAETRGRSLTAGDAAAEDEARVASTSPNGEAGASNTTFRHLAGRAVDLSKHVSGKLEQKLQHMDTSGQRAPGLGEGLQVGQQLRDQTSTKVKSLGLNLMGKMEKSTKSSEGLMRSRLAGFMGRSAPVTLGPGAADPTAGGAEGEQDPAADQAPMCSPAKEEPPPVEEPPPAQEPSGA